MKNNLIYEKFTQNSDPIKDLGIGIKRMWKKQKQTLWTTSFAKIHEKYFAKYELKFNWELCEAFCDIIGYLIEGIDPQTAFDNACERYSLLKYDGSKMNDHYREILAEVANKEFHINVTPNKKVNEKFTQDSDPVSDLNIGLAAQLDKWIKTIDEYKMGYASKEKDYLWICSKHGKEDFVRYLLEKGADVHANNDYALQWASENGHEQVVKLLLDAGADVHARNDAALRRASENGYDKVVKLLLDVGANVHANDDAALRWASENGYDKVVKLLLDVGADVHAENDAALRWASENGYDKVVKILKDHIAKEKKIVRENLNEKFTQDSDPIRDLNIGIITFDNINIGDVLICVKPSVKFTFNDDSEFPRNGVYILYKKKIYPDKKLSLGFLPYGFLSTLSEKDLNDIRNRCKTGDIPHYWTVHTNVATLKEWEKHFRILQPKELKTYGVYESLNEKFTRESDPIEDMNIGIKNKILTDLKSFGIDEKNVTFEDDGTIKYNGYSKPYGFVEVQMKYMPNEKKEFVKEIIQMSTKSFTREQLEKSVAKALKNNISKEDIKNLIEEFGVHTLNTSAKIIIEKLTRTKKQIAHDKTHNVYIFIGFNDKVAVKIKGKKYYEDRLGTESIIKIDKFNEGDLKMVSMAKIRARVQYFDQDGQVYMIELPKEVLDGDRYEKIPDHLYDIFDKYKRRV